MFFFLVMLLEGGAGLGCSPPTSYLGSSFLGNILLIAPGQVALSKGDTETDGEKEKEEARTEQEDDPRVDT